MLPLALSVVAGVVKGIYSYQKMVKCKEASHPEDLVKVQQLSAVISLISGSVSAVTSVVYFLNS